MPSSFLFCGKFEEFPTKQKRSAKDMHKFGRKIK